MQSSKLISFAFLQLDLLVVPPSPALEQTLRETACVYRKCRLDLSEVLEAAYSLTGKYSMENDFLALSIGPAHSEDGWCIDHRGLLVISLMKETYQRLGIVGEKLSKRSKERFVVQIDLHDRQSSLFTRARDCIRSWDARRKSQGIGKWEVLLQGSLPIIEESQQIESAPSCTILSNVLVPTMDKIDLACGKFASKDDDLFEDWQEWMEGLFEWVGVACIGSDRLKANDRVNPFVAVYEAPEPSTVGNVEHLRWRGFLCPSTVQSILQTTIDVISKEGQDSSTFIAVTANTFADAPISYISPKAFAEGAKNEVRLGRSGSSVRCWSLLLRPSKESDVEAEWALARVESQL